MTRLFATLRWDVVRQFRSGFYYASAFFVLVWAAIFVPLPAGGVNFQLLLPPVMLINMTVIAFYYISALVLLEKSEGSLTSVVVSPLRNTEYLASKLLSLTFLAVLESGLMIVLIYGFDFRPGLLLAGLLLLGGIYVLAGFIAIARYEALNAYLLPSIPIVTFLILPAIDALGVWESALFYLHPAQPALTLMRAALGPAAGWEIAYGLLGSLAWLAVGFSWAQRRFERFIVQGSQF